MGGSFALHIVLMLSLAFQIGTVSSAESTTTRKAGGLDFTAIGGKRQGREVPQSLRVESRRGGIWKTQQNRRKTTCCKN